MEKYEQITVVGEGSYGCVMKCRHRETGQIVAIKKFLDTEEELSARRMVMREIRMLKKLRHENLICLIEVFRVRKRFYLVFEFVDRTVLDELEDNGNNGLDEQSCRERIVQVIRGVRYCHLKHIIHRDVKPENVLVSKQGVIKLCDFGFARLLGNTGEPCTEYVATRWYRAPELLVADVHYGPAVDVWAIACLFSEMMTGKPLFPGDSDIDQLYRICSLLGQPCYRHLQLLQKNANFKSIPKASNEDTIRVLSKTFPTWSPYAIDFLAVAMRMDPTLRATTDELMKHPYLNHDRFVEKFLPKLRQKVLQEYQENPLIRKYQADILMASDDRRQDMYQERYAKKLEQPRWKINLQDPYIKRKTSYISFSSFKNGDVESQSQPSNYCKNVIQPSTNYMQDGDKIKNNFQKTNTKLEQRKQHITDHMKFSKNAIDSKENETKSNNERPSSDKNIELHLNSPSPLIFASLQPETNRKSPSEILPKAYAVYANYQNNQNILHPSINNLSFTKNTYDPIKRSIQTQLQNISGKTKESTTNHLLKTTFQNVFSNKSPVPLNQSHPPHKENFIKKLTRGLVLDVTQLGNNENNNSNQTTNVLTKTPPGWLNTAGYTMYKKNNQVEQTTWTKLDPCATSERSEKTSFPNINGGSPYKKKKLPQFIPMSHDPVNTPRDNSSKSQSLQHRQNNNFSTNNLPFM